MVILTVGVPLVALGVLAWELLRGRQRDHRVKRSSRRSARVRPVVTVVEVGVFASRFVEHVTERQLLSVAPPIFVAFMVWLGRGMPRPQPVTSVIAIAVAASGSSLERITTRAATAGRTLADRSVPAPYPSRR